MEAGFKPWPELDGDGDGDKALKGSSVGLQIHVPLLKTMKQGLIIKN